MRLIKFKWRVKPIYINPLQVVKIEPEYNEISGEYYDDGTVITFSRGDKAYVEGNVTNVVQKINDEFNKLAINNVGTLTIN